MRLDKINTEEAFRYLGYGISAPDEQTAEIAADCERKLRFSSIWRAVMVWYCSQRHCRTELTGL